MWPGSHFCLCGEFAIEVLTLQVITNSSKNLMCVLARSRLRVLLENPIRGDFPETKLGVVWLFTNTVADCGGSRGAA